MHPGRRRTMAPLLAALGLLGAGCAQGSFSRGPLMVGTLKTELARAEQESQSYRRRIAELEAENTRIANELAQERAFSSDLEARLTDARDLLDRRGLATEPSIFDSPPAPSTADWEDSQNGRTMPAADSPQSRRKAPFAQISGGIRTTPDPENEPVDPDYEERRYDDSPAPYRRDPLGPQSRAEPPVRWLPVADTTSAEATKG